ncbi:copper resistance CopC family protein [Micromonospora citrea]|uniref:copper resistance CopC family protein n=1 Tax=Micromonospora citrea TaxID=47855 RepID=UPI003C3DC22A
MPTPARRTVATLVATALTAVALLLVPASPAVAHNSLLAATPAEDAVLTAPPGTITLKFLQKLNPTFTTITLSDANQRKVPTSDPVVTGATGAVTVAQALPNGSYTVAYRVVSTDGHPVQGSYRFTVADPTADTPIPPAATPAAPTDQATPAAPVSSLAAGQGPPLGLIITGVTLAVIAVITAMLRRRARRR